MTSQISNSLLLVVTFRYDGLLAAGSDWDKLCKHAMFHGGDSDSTGVVAGACFGGMYGFRGVPDGNYKVNNN